MERAISPVTQSLNGPSTGVLSDRETLELLETRIKGLVQWIEGRDWRGFDPYDGLRTLPFKPSASRLRQLQTQLVKRSPIDLRRPFGPSPFVMSKSLALGLMAMNEVDDQERVARLQPRLLDRRLDGGLWGYEFDVQTRWGYYPAGSPNAIATSFALHALAETLAEEEVDELELSVRSVISRFLDSNGSGPFFRYTEASPSLVHNANLLTAAAVARIGRKLGNEEWVEVALDAAGTSVASQGPRGSWAYGEGSGLGWVDGLHTAYVLVALDWLASPGLTEHLDKGLSFYLDRLFTEDQRPLARASGRTTGGAHTVATGLWALSRLARTRRDLDLALGVLTWAERLRKPDGSYRTSSTNRISYMRWGQAHMLLGLASLRHALEIS